MRRLLLAAAALSAVLTSTAARGDDTARQLRVGYVTDAGVIGDGAIGEESYKGFVKAIRELGVEGHVLLVPPRGGPAGALSTFGSQRYDLIIAGAFLAKAPVQAAARRFPHSQFFYTGGPGNIFDRRLMNMRGLVIHVEEAGYLAGYLAGLVEARQRGTHVVGAVGGIPEVADVANYIGGYRAGARKADPTVRVLVRYSGDFANPRKCQTVADREIAAGAGVIFQVAGYCGFGALEAAKQRHVWGIGVDLDQSGLGSHILTSAVLRFETALRLAIKSFKDGTWRARTDIVLTLADGGVGLGRISPKVPSAFLRRIDEIRKEIRAGTITIPRVPG